MSSSRKLMMAAAGTAGGDFYPYTVDNSCLIDGTDKFYRTPGSASDRKTFTISTWLKKCRTTVQTLFHVDGSGAGDSFWIQWNANGTLNFGDYNSVNSYTLRWTTDQVFRDYSAFYHFVFAYDTTAAAAADRLKVYVNNVELDQTGWAKTTTPAQDQNLGWNNNQQHEIGEYADALAGYECGSRFSETVSINAAQLTPSSFGEDKSGVWCPSDVSGLTFGTNGFYLDFKDGSSATTLGYDVSGNANNWTPSGIATTDQTTDTPTNNFAALNPLVLSARVNLSDGNLVATGNSAAESGLSYGTIGLVTGKWYFEATITSDSGSYPNVGFQSLIIYPNNGDYVGDASGLGVAYRQDGTIYLDGAIDSTGLSTYTTADVIGCAIDMDGGSVEFFKNNTSVGTATLTEDIYFPAVDSYNSSIVTVEFGQGGFTYTPPTGYLAICTENMPEPTIGPNIDENSSGTTSDENFDTLLWTGNGSSSRDITGLDFTPDFTWIKNRSYGTSHILSDAVRGDNKFLSSNGTGLEDTDSTKFRTFVTGGIQVGSHRGVNYSGGETYVAWNWKANGSGATNEDGTIDSTVSVNQDAGVSIVTYTGTGSAGTIGHGLGVAPKVLLLKGRTSTVGNTNWMVYHEAIGNGKRLFLNLTNAENTNAIWNNTSPTSSVFSLTAGSEWNQSASDTYVCYAFAEVEGFSKFGSFVGATGSEFIYTGFRPAFVMVKRTNVSGWYIFDNERGYNGGINGLQPNTAGADSGPWATQFNLYSNGFEDNGFVGDAGTTIIYMAFAEMPFKYSNAR